MWCRLRSCILRRGVELPFGSKGLISGVNDRDVENPEIGVEGTGRPPDRINAIARSTASIDGAHVVEIDDVDDVISAVVVEDAIGCDDDTIGIDCVAGTSIGDCSRDDVLESSGAIFETATSP